MFSFSTITNGISQMLWGSNTSKKNNSQNADDVPPIVLVIENTFSSRLDAINYNEKFIPDYFLCPVIFTIMDNPVMVNKLQSNTYDNASLNQCLVTQPDFDPLRVKIEVINGKKNIRSNTERIAQIEIFVSTLEIIKKLHGKIEYLDEIAINQPHIALQDLCFSPNENRLLLMIAHEENKKSILRKKVILAIKLELFISHTEMIIHAEHKKLTEKLVEIQRITAEKHIYLSLLLKEIAEAYPTIFFNQPANVDIFFSTMSEIRELQEQLEILEKTKTNMDDSLQDTGSPPEELCKEKIRSIIQSKLDLIAKLEILFKNKPSSDTDTFISILNKIQELQTKIKVLETTTIDGLDDSLLDILPNYSDQILKEQRENQKESILQAKLMLAMELKTFITLMNTATPATNKEHEEDILEIKKITAEKDALFEVLAKELTPIYPQIFLNQAVNIKEDNSNPFENRLQRLPCNSLLLRQFALCNRPLSNMQNRFFYANSFLATNPYMLVMACVYVTALQKSFNNGLIEGIDVVDISHLTRSRSFEYRQ